MEKQMLLERTGYPLDRTRILLSSGLAYRTIEEPHWFWVNHGRNRGAGVSVSGPFDRFDGSSESSARYLKKRRT
jgi:hypothetical protein